ncbi:MAG: tRNA lysidine(34) synthetase TilS [Bacteriovoracaceae bacterium]
MLKPIQYRNLFFSHVWQFLSSVCQSQCLKGSHLIAVSGGLDSMTLLWLAARLYHEGKIGPVRAVYVHHQTRKGQDEELNLIEKFCKELRLPFKVLKVNWGPEKAPKANFEALARKKRRALLLDDLKKNETIWMGHHLDDSYEWWLMQRSRSTNLKAALGIPVRNGPIIRPFLCVTRKQIEKIAGFEGLKFIQDPTNKDTRFDRNYLRHEVIPRIKKRYPKYLKHYAHMSNFGAQTLNVSLLNHGHGHIFVYKDGALLVGEKFAEYQIRELIHQFSTVKRGELTESILKMLKAISKKKKGPFHFSGGVSGYYSGGTLLIYPKSLKNHDSSIAQVLNQLTQDQLQQFPHSTYDELEIMWKNFLKSPDVMRNSPGLVLVLETESIKKTLNTSTFDALFPEVSQVVKNKNLRFIPMVKCLEIWKQKKGKLPDRLKLLPLWNLANLLPS